MEGKVNPYGGTSPTPTPTPTPTSTGSQKFIIRDHSQANADIMVHSYAAYISTNVVSSPSQGSQGTLVSGPVLGTDSAWWWQVNYDTGADGWNGESVLTKIASATATPTPAQYPVPFTPHQPQSPAVSQVRTT
jgi:hypothetical protein